MNLFEEIEDMENLYKNLINEALERHSSEVREIRNKYIDKINDKTKKMDEFIHSILRDLDGMLEKKVLEFKDKADNLLLNIQEEYKKSKQNFIDTIIKTLEITF